MSSIKITKGKKRKIWEKYGKQLKNHFLNMQMMGISSAITELYTEKKTQDFVDDLLVLLQKNPLVISEKENSLQLKFPEFNPVYFNFYQLLLYEDDEGKTCKERLVNIMDSLSFQRVTYSQNLIILCAYFESFLEQSIIALSNVSPNYKKYIGKGKYKQLEIIIEEIKGSLKEKENLYKVIKEFFEIRNLFVHRNGVVDRKFIRNTGNEKFPEGSDYPLISEIVLACYIMFLTGMISLFFIISEKYFDIKPEELRDLSVEIKSNEK
ncbi:MAG: hypothetical protein GPJ52_11655 [Candidatus Heimdallarchaeota archaeon]|nr:hypothetical protein [Candidatus Heimdallarchaeota archaeon]